MKIGLTLVISKSTVLSSTFTGVPTALAYTAICDVGSLARLIE